MGGILRGGGWRLGGWVGYHGGAGRVRSAVVLASGLVARVVPGYVVADVAAPLAAVGDGGSGASAGGVDIGVATLAVAVVAAVEAAQAVVRWRWRWRL